MAEIHTAAAEVGQGLMTVLEQIARTELDVDRVVVLPADTAVGSAGSTLGVAPDLDERRRGAAGVRGCARSCRAGGRDEDAPIEILLADEPVDETAVHRHRPTQPLDPETGQGDSLVAVAFAAHRAVCDVDGELGLVRAVEIATTQDVGRVMNPLALEGQIQGGIAQGLGLALMEEIQMRDGRVRNASFTDYLMPTVLDMPPVRMSISETPHPHAPVRPERGGRDAHDRVHARPGGGRARRHRTRPAAGAAAPVRHRRSRVSDGEDRAGFVARLGHVAEGSPWVAERAFGLGPFADREAVAEAFAQVVREAPAEEQLALIRAHPDLAGRAALAGELTPESAGEQASAGLDRLTPPDLARLTRLNDAYRARFGFPFVICVRGRSVASILEALERRLANGADAERATAVDEIAAIMRLRLETAP